MRAIHRQILNLAWPAIATNITTPLLSLADVAIVGHIEGGNLIGAVAVGGTVFNILYWLFAFLRMGTSGMTAQAFGAGNVGEQRRVLMRGGIIAVSGGILLLMLSPLVGEPAMHLIDGGSSVGPLAWRYFRLVILGAPGVLVTFVISGWLLGMQRSKPIMWIALTTNVLNILLSLIFVFGFGLGIDGVALGTAISQIAGAFIGIGVVVNVLRTLPTKEYLGDTMVPVDWTIGLMDSRAWKKMFKINGDIFLRTLCLASVTLWFTHAGTVMGTNILAANSLLLQLFLIFSYFMDGFAFGGEALSGRYWGAHNFSALRRTVKALAIWGIIASLIFTTLYFVAGDTLLGFLTNDMSVLETAHEYSLWAVLVPLLGFSAFTWDGIFIGLTRTRYLLCSMAVAMVVFFGVYYIGTQLLKDHFAPNHVLWLAFLLYLSTRGVVSILLYGRFRRHYHLNKQNS